MDIDEDPILDMKLNFKDAKTDTKVGTSISIPYISIHHPPISLLTVGSLI